MISNTTLAALSSSAISSYATSANPASSYQLGSPHANNLGYGLGRLARGVFDKIADAWQGWWNPISAELKSRVSTSPPLVSTKVAPTASGLLQKQRSVAQNRLAGDCVIPTDLTIPDPTKFFKLEIQGTLSNIARIGDINGDGKSDFAIGEKTANTPGGTQGAGRVWIIYGGTDVSSIDLTNVQANQGLVFYGTEANAALGQAVVGLGDFNGDGKADVAIGGRKNIYILFGPVQNQVDLTACDGVKCVKIIDGSGGNSFSCLAAGKDINSDQVPDLMIGASSLNTFFALFGKTGPWPAQLDVRAIASPNGFIGTGQSLTGCPIAMGDVKDSPIAAFAVGAQAVSSPINQGGAVYYLNGRSTWPGSFDVAQEAGSNGFIAYGGTQERVPQGLVIGGDFNGDNKSDILVTSRDVKLYDIFGQPSTSPIQLGNLETGMKGHILQEPNIPFGYYFGSPAVDLIDINNDGQLDIAMALSNSGNVQLILGQPGGLPAELNATSTSSAPIIEKPSIDKLGVLLANLGDVNGDGLDDLGMTTTSTLYVVLGQPTVCPTASPGSGSSTGGGSGNNVAVIAGVVGGVAAAAALTTGSILYLRHAKKGCFAEEELPNQANDEGLFDNL